MKIETGLEKKFIETTPLPSFGNSWAFGPNGHLLLSAISDISTFGCG